MRVTKKSLPFQPSDFTFTARHFSDKDIGDLVYITSETQPTVSKASIDDSDKMPAIGVVTAISGNQCEVQYRGEVNDIYFGLIPGRSYFVGENSRPSLEVPNNPGCFVQKIGVALKDDILLLVNSSFILRRAAF